MKNSQNKITVVSIVGPTGAGKTAAALALAQTFPLSVINADSRQVYSDFPIITAQPSQEEQAQCPHHLYGWLPTKDPIGVGRYVELATGKINDVCAINHLPLLVGGTGLYCKTLFEGVAEIPPIDEGIRHTIQEQWSSDGPAIMGERLKKVDPEYAAKIHSNDKQRTTRALEVWEATGKPFSWWHAQPLPPSPYHVISIGIRKPLDLLEPLLKKRISIMMEMGAKKEAENALQNCNDEEAPGWSGIGCKEMFLFLKGELTMDACLELWYRNTRAYAKRQLTWFNADKKIIWFAPDETKAIVNTVSELLNSTSFSIEG